MLTNGLSGTTAIPAYFRCGSLFPVCRTCIKVSHPYGPAPLAGRPAHQKPYIAGSCSLRNNQLKAKLLGLFRERSDLLLAIPGFIVFGPFVNVRLTVLDEPVEQAG